MSRVFAAVVAFLLVYNLLQLCPTIAKDRNLVMGVKIGVVIITVALVKLILNRDENNKQASQGGKWTV